MIAESFPLEVITILPMNVFLRNQPTKNKHLSTSAELCQTYKVRERANDEIKHNWTTHRDLDGNPGVNPVLVIEIDAIDPQPPQAPFAGGSHVRRIPADLPLPIR